MNIAFDAKRILYNRTGLGNYSRFVVNSLSSFYPENSYHLYAPGMGNDNLRKEVNTNPSVLFHYPEPPYTLFKSFWRSFGILNDLKREKPDIYHGLSNELPFGLKKAGIPSVVSIHDLIFIRYPEFYKKIDRTIYNYKFKQACLQADRVIAISEMTKRDIISTYHIDEAKVDVVYQGCGSLFLDTATESRKEEVKARYNLPSHYILYVGSIEQRKNLLFIVRALRQLNKGIRLIAIGKRTPYADEVESYIRENNMQDEVSLLSNIPYADLPVFYQMASLFVYPSFFEGFGIPIIEAMNCNVPVIAATGSCLEEAGGPDSLYVDPTDINDLSEKIDWVLSTPSQSDKMRKAGKLYAHRFTARQIAGDMMAVYKKIYSLHG